MQLQKILLQLEDAQWEPARGNVLNVIHLLIAHKDLIVVCFWLPVQRISAAPIFKIIKHLRLHISFAWRFKKSQDGKLTSTHLQTSYFIRTVAL